MLRGSRGLPGLQSALTKPALEGSGGVASICTESGAALSGMGSAVSVSASVGGARAGWRVSRSEMKR